uniref:Uncharacterized protein n=1 Tax=Rhizophora mucronata TaxID=61149 RepID=A0A2P2R4Z6_RHIMU
MIHCDLEVTDSSYINGLFM